MTNGIQDNDAGDGATADRIADELCPADRTNPTWRYLVRQAVLKGIQAERARTWRAERASRTPPADAVARLTKLADDYASRGDFATEDDIRTLLAAYEDAARDRERLDWLGVSLATLHCNFCHPDDFTVTVEAPGFGSAREYHGDTPRAAIDAARTGEAR